MAAESTCRALALGRAVCVEVRRIWGRLGSAVGPAGAGGLRFAEWAEALEARRMLTVTPTLSAPNAAYVGATYTVGISTALSANSDGVEGMSIDFGDGSVVDWGDGTGDQSFAGTTTEVSHVFAHGGTDYQVTVTADSADGPVQGNADISVNPPSSPAGDPLESIAFDGEDGSTAGSLLSVRFAAIRGSNADEDSADISSNYTIDWGDGTSSPADGSKLGDSEFDGSGSHIYAHDGQYLVTATDDSNGDASSIFVDVNSPVPTLTPIPDQTVDEGGSATFSATIDNPVPGAFSEAYYDDGDGTGYHPATISGNTITAVLPDIFTPTTATLTLADGTTVPASQPVNLTVVAPVISLTATDGSNSQNTVTDHGLGVGGSNLYVAVGGTGSAVVDFSLSAIPYMTGKEKIVVSHFAGVPPVWGGTWPNPTLTITRPASNKAADWDYTVDAMEGNSVDATIVVRVFQLEITDANGTPLSATTPTPELVGQKVTLVSKLVGDPPPTDANQPFPNWTIPGDEPEPQGYATAIAGFGLDGSAPTLLSYSDRSAASISYYWIAPSDEPEQVTYTIKLGGGVGNCTVSAPFTAGAPSYTFTATTQGPNGTSLDTKDPRSRGGWYLHYGTIDFNAPDKQGVIWNGSVLAGPSEAGEIGLVQVATIDDTFKDPENNTWASVASGAVDSPRKNSPFYYSAKPLAANGAADLTLTNGLPRGDTPRVVLTGPIPAQIYGTPFYSVSINETFTDYLMYQPTASPGGVWVTLATMTWTFTASAHFDRQTLSYILDASEGPPAALESAVSSALPEWSGWASDAQPKKKG